MSPPQPSVRSTHIKTFQVMRILQKATLLSSTSSPASPPILHLEIGQPSQPPPPQAVTSAKASLSLPASSQGYTPASGLLSLRQALSTHYHTNYSLSVPSDHILVTTGSSGAFTALFATLFDPADNVALVIPGYPCYRHVLQALSISIIPLHVSAETDYQPTLSQLQAAHGTHKIKGLILASPSNPTGATISAHLLHSLAQYCAGNGIWLISDEIYHGISQQTLPTAAQFPYAIVVSSFSKFWCMPGFRVGWVVVNCAKTRHALENALQNMALCAPTVAQYAAIGALKPECRGLLEERAAQYLRAADVLLGLLQKAGFQEVVRPRGAFYLWAGCERVCKKMRVQDSVELCEVILKEARVAVTPGIDFDEADGKRFVRFSCTVTGDVEEAGKRILKLVGESIEIMGE